MGINPRSLRNLQPRNRTLGFSREHILELLETHGSLGKVARILGCSYHSVRNYAIRHGLFDQFRKEKYARRYNADMDDVLLGNRPEYPAMLVENAIYEKNLIPRVCEECGYDRQRPDGDSPVRVVWVDGNKSNHTRQNLKMLCYNCIFMAGLHSLNGGRFAEVTGIDVSKLLKEYPQHMNWEGFKKFAGGYGDDI